MTIVSTLGLFPDFVPGKQLEDGGQLLQLAKFVCGFQDGLVAKAGGGSGTTVKLTPGSNRVSTCATAADSVILPPAIPFQMCILVNDGAASCRTFPNQANPANPAANGNPQADAIAPDASSVYGASADTANTAVSLFLCVALGKWKQVLVT